MRSEIFVDAYQIGLCFTSFAIYAKVGICRSRKLEMRKQEKMAVYFALVSFKYEVEMR